MPSTSKSQRRAPEETGRLTFKPLTPQVMDAMGEVLRGSWGSGCWCLYPRLTDAQTRALPGNGSLNQRRREAMTRLASRKPAPGLLAFDGEEPVGWIAIGRRPAFARVTASRATPPVDSHDVWIIPCITVRKSVRGRGIAIALVQAAVKYAAQQGATIVEAYPRAGDTRVGDDNAYFGTEHLFRRAGFTVVRGPLQDRPKNWVPRLAMRIDATRTRRASAI